MFTPPCVVVGYLIDGIEKALNTTVQEFCQIDVTKKGITRKRWTWIHKKEASTVIKSHHVEKKANHEPKLYKRLLTLQTAEEQICNTFQIAKDSLQHGGVNLAANYFEIAYKGAKFLLIISQKDSPHQLPLDTIKLTTIKNASQIGIACKKLSKTVADIQTLPTHEKPSYLNQAAIKFIEFLKHRETFLCEVDASDFKQFTLHIIEIYLKLFRDYTPEDQEFDFKQQSAIADLEYYKKHLNVRQAKL